MKPQCAAVSRPKHFPCSVVTLLFATVALLITAGPARAEPVFTPDADYRILTIYGVNTSIELADYQAEGVTATFVLKSCDTSRADYYSTANVTDGKLKLTSNTLGHVHGSNTNTESETVCTVTGTAGSDTEDGVFSLYTVSDRAPHQLDALSLSEARPDAVDIQITGVPDSSYVRLGWRKSGGTPTFRLVSGVSSGTVLTIPNLDVNTEYEIRAYLMTRQSFDLYRSGNTGMPGTLISEGAPARKWIGNLTSSGLGKSQTINVMTAALPTLRINDVTVAEASGAAAAFTVTLNAVSAQVVTVAYATSAGTASAGLDYTSISSTLTIPAGRLTGTIRVPILDDTLDEPDETFTVTLSSPTNATISDNSGTGTITDEDNLEVTVSYEVGSYTVTEGEFIDVTVVLSEPPGRPIVVSVTVMPDSGAVETDYSGVPESVTFGPSETQKTFIFRAVEDAEYDDGEIVVLGFGILPSGVTASDPETSIVTIEDNDFAADVEPKQWLVRFGRTAVVHVTDALDERMRCPPDRRPVEISPNRLPGEISPERRPRWRCRPLHREPQSMAIGGHWLASGVNQTEAFERYAAGQRRDEWMLYGGTLGDWDADAFRSLTVNEFLARSSFHVSSEEEEGWRLSFWGRGAFSRFDGFDGGHTLDGDVTTSTFGVDNAGDRWLSGVALSRSEGEGTFSQDDFEGEFASSLTGLYPYLRYGVSERLSIWGMMGYGAGTLTFTADDVASIETDIDMTMGAVGLRGELLSPADEKDFALTFKADALFMRTASDVVPGLKAAEAEVNRLRLGIEGSWEFVSEDGQWLSPRIEAGLRHDGGDAETGLGVEIGAGLRYAHPEQYLTMELNARSLLTHDAVGLAEWGVSGSLRYDPRPPSELGPSFTLSPSWGAWTSGGVDALWKRADIAALAANDEAAPAGRIDAELAYGFATLDGLAIGTPLTGISLSESMRAFRLGYRISLAHREDLDFNLSFEGMRRENTRGDEPPEYGCLLRFSIRW